MEMLPICFDAKINIVPVTVRIKLNIFNVFDCIFKFVSMESSPSVLIIAFMVIVSNEKMRFFTAFRMTRFLGTVFVWFLGTVLFVIKQNEKNHLQTLELLLIWVYI